MILPIIFRVHITLIHHFLHRQTLPTVLLVRVDGRPLRTAPATLWLPDLTTIPLLLHYWENIVSLQQSYRHDSKVERLDRRTYIIGKLTSKSCLFLVLCYYYVCYFSYNIINYYYYMYIHNSTIYKNIILSFIFIRRTLYKILHNWHILYLLRQLVFIEKYMKIVEFYNLWRYSYKSSDDHCWILSILFNLLLCNEQLLNLLHKSFIIYF